MPTSDAHATGKILNKLDQPQPGNWAPLELWALPPGSVGEPTLCVRFLVTKVTLPNGSTVEVNDVRLVAIEPDDLRRLADRIDALRTP